MKALSRRYIGFTSRYDVLIVMAAWALTTFFLYLKFGFGFNLESIKYIREADHLLGGNSFSQARYLFYSGTIAVIAIASFLKLGLYGAVAIILLVNLLSYLYFYRSLRRFFNAQAPAITIILLLLTFWPYQLWSLFLYTECLFYSLFLLLLGKLLNAKQLRVGLVATVILLLIALMLTRPLGILFVLPALAFFYTLLSSKQRLFFWGILVVFLAIGAWVVQVVFTSTPDWNMQRAIMEENIICDMTPASITYSPEVTTNPNPLYQLGYYVTHNFFHFMQLALTRLRYFFGVVRPYYSTTTNLFIGAYLAFMYLSILVGWRKPVRLFPARLRWFMWGSVSLFAITVALQCDDYHSRFFLTLLPVFVLVAVGNWWKWMLTKHVSA